MKMINIKKKWKYKNNTGFTVLEIIITVAIVSFGIVGLYGIFSPFISLSYNASARLKAIHLAQEGFEIVKNIRDNNFIESLTDPNAQWFDGLLGCDGGCQADYKTGTPQEGFDNQMKPYSSGNFLKLNSDGFYSYDQAGSNTIFKRKITITQQPGVEVLKVEVLVTWSYNNNPYSYKIEESLYNWY